MSHWLVAAFLRYGYAAVFVGIFLENLGVPVPGETVLLAAGFFSRQHVLRLGIVIPVAIVAAIAGDNFGYWIGRRGGRRFVERYGKYVGLSAKRLSSVESYFHEHGPRTVFFARFISGIRVVAALTAGVSRLPWPQFLIYNAAGAVAWGTVIALAGFLFGQSWSLLERWVGRGGILIFAVVAALVLLAILRRHRRKIAAWIDDWLPGALTLHEAWLIGASVIAIGLLSKITEDVVARESTPFDDAVMAAITGIALPGFETLMKIANAAGSGPAVVGATVVALAWLWRRGRRGDVEVLATLAIVTQVLDAVFKNFVHRIRPEPLHALTSLYAASFPSGHAMNAVAMYGFLAFLVPRERVLLRRSAFAVVAIVSLAIGVARVYLRLHWATDVLGGYCMGLLLLSMAVFWEERVEPAPVANKSQRP